MQPIQASELILNRDGSVYHLHIKAEHVADTVIVVGDPKRVHQISSKFQKVTHVISNREFETHVGYYNDKKITVLSTGIGTDNIDIVLNELDAAVNINLDSRKPKSELRSLNIIRLGTSGALQPDIPIDTLLVSEMALGFDGLLHYYKREYSTKEHAIAKSFMQHAQWPEGPALPYAISADKDLFAKLSSGLNHGITATAPGFYAPQDRAIRLQPAIDSLSDKLRSFQFDNQRVTNFEMETSALFGLSSLLGHKACTVCAIIANRSLGAFSKNPAKSVETLITTVLDKLTN